MKRHQMYELDWEYGQFSGHDRVVIIVDESISNEYIKQSLEEKVTELYKYPYSVVVTKFHTTR